MNRAIALCLPLLLACAAAAADDAASTDKAPQAAAAGKGTPGKSDSAANSDRAANSDSSAKKDGPAKADAAKPAGDVKMSGMSILGNEDSPKSLVIVPWKSSQMGDMPGVSRLLDPSTQPVDKDVFMRELAYYEIKANGH